MIEKHRVIKGEGWWKVSIKGEHLFLGSLLFGLWFFTPLFIGFLSGLDEKYCMEKPRNAERFLPSYKLGCWLGATQGKQWYYKSK